MFFNPDTYIPGYNRSCANAAKEAPFGAPGMSLPFGLSGGRSVSAGQTVSEIGQPKSTSQRARSRSSSNVTTSGCDR